MLVRIFRSTQIYPIALIVLFSIVIHTVLGLLHPVSVPISGTNLFLGLSNGIFSLPSWVLKITVFILLTSQALYLNYILNKHEIFFKQSWLPALFYLIFSTQFPMLVQFTPLVVLNSIFIIIIDKIFSLYKNQKTIGITFDTALLMSLVALIYAPAIFMILLFFIGIAILKPISWRDFSIGLIGLIVPLSIIITIYFLCDNLEGFILHYKSGIASGIRWDNYIQPSVFLSSIIIGIVFLISLLKLRKYYLKNVTKSRLCQQILVIFFFIGVSTIPFAVQKGLQNYIILLIPLSSIIAYFFLDGKKIIYQELILWILIGNWIYSNFV